MRTCSRRCAFEKGERRKVLVLVTDGEDLERGHQLFDVHCARCHGIGGTGGMGPPLARAKLRRAPDDPSLLAVLGGGIPGKAMPAFWQLSEGEVAQVAAYVRSLGRRPAETAPGDPARGKALYDGKLDYATAVAALGARC